MRSRKLLALLFCLITFPAIAGYMTLLGAGVGSIAPVVSWVSTTDAFPSSSLTFSRTSNATMFDSTGKLTYAPNNLLTQSNTFSNAAWTKNNVTVSAGATDPLGGTSASTITATSSTNAYVFQGATAPVGARIASQLYVKRRSGSGSVFLYDQNGFTNTVDITSSISGGGWVAINPTVLTASGSSAYVGVKINTSGDAVDVYAGVVSAVTYETAVRAPDQVITTSSAYYGPRIDYDPNTLAVKGLLIEEARTNLALQSNDLTTGSWPVSGVSKSTDGTLGPDGKSLMVKALAAAAGGPHEIYQALAVTSGTAYASSIFVKKGNHRYVAISFEVSSGLNGFLAVFDLDNPSAATQSFSTGASTLVNYGIINEGGGIYRIYVAGTAGASGTGYLLAHLVSGATIPTGTVEPTNFAATGTEYAYFFGGQFEVGLFPTSYIPTAAASVTRAADVVQFTGPALTALQGSAGSVIVQSISEASSSPTAITNVIKGTNSILYRDTTGKTGTTNGTTALLTAAAPTWSSAIRNGLAWSASGRSLGYTSSAIATDANTVSNGGTLYLGSSAGSAVESGWYQSLGIWNQRLPDATLSTKLTVGGPYAANDNANPFAPKFAANDNLPVHWRIAL